MLYCSPSTRTDLVQKWTSLARKSTCLELKSICFLEPEWSSFGPESGRFEEKDFELDLSLEMTEILQMETETEAGVQIGEHLIFLNRVNCRNKRYYRLWEFSIKHRIFNYFIWKFMKSQLNISLKNVNQGEARSIFRKLKLLDTHMPLKFQNHHYWTHF